MAADFLSPAGDNSFSDHLFYGSYTVNDVILNYGRKTMRNNKLFKLCFAGIFTAIAYISTFFVYITVAGFLTYDVKDALITVCSMILGPLYGVAMSLIVSFIELITVSGTGFWGFLMNFVSSSVFAAVAAWIYRRCGKLYGAFLGLGTSVVSMTAIMVLMNIFITPIYSGQPTEVILTMIPTILFPFNLTKAVLNAGLVLILYKPLITALRKARILPASKDKAPENRQNSFWNGRTLLVIVVALILISVSIAYMIWGLGGNFGS